MSQAANEENHVGGTGNMNQTPSRWLHWTGNTGIFWEPIIAQAPLHMYCIRICILFNIFSLGDGQCTLKFKKYCTSRYQKKSDQGFLGGSVVKKPLVNADEKGSTCIRHELKPPR